MTPAAGILRGQRASRRTNERHTSASFRGSAWHILSYVAGPDSGIAPSLTIDGTCSRDCPGPPHAHRLARRASLKDRCPPSSKRWARQLRLHCRSRNMGVIFSRIDFWANVAEIYLRDASTGERDALSMLLGSEFSALIICAGWADNSIPAAVLLLVTQATARAIHWFNLSTRLAGRDKWRKCAFDSL